MSSAQWHRGEKRQWTLVSHSVGYCHRTIQLYISPVYWATTCWSTVLSQSITVALIALHSSFSVEGTTILHFYSQHSIVAYRNDDDVVVHQLCYVDIVHFLTASPISLLLLLIGCTFFKTGNENELASLWKARLKIVLSWESKRGNKLLSKYLRSANFSY